MPPAMQVRKWLKVFDYRSLDAFLSSEREKGGVRDACLSVLAATLLYQVPMLLARAVGGLPALPDPAGVAASLAFAVVSGMAAFVLLNWTLHYICVLMGGRGSYGSLLWLQSFMVGASALVSLAFLFPLSLAGRLLGLSFLTVAVGAIDLALFIGLSIYLIYIGYRVAVVNYGMPKGPAINAMIINLVLWVAVLVAVGVALFWALIGSLLAGKLPF